jgi:hypothetical protein
MLGVGTIEDDIEMLLDALQNFDAQNDSNALGSCNARNDFHALASFDAQNDFHKPNNFHHANGKLDSLDRLASSHSGDGFLSNGGSDSGKKYNFPTPIDQVLSPRIASMAPSHQVSIADAENLIASECIAPCPPGIPICVPGQRLTKEVLNQIRKDHVRIVATNNSANSSR